MPLLLHRIATSGKMDEFDVDDDFDNDWSYEYEKRGWLGYEAFMYLLFLVCL